MGAGPGRAGLALGTPLPCSCPGATIGCGPPGTGTCCGAPGTGVSGWPGCVPGCVPGGGARTEVETANTQSEYFFASLAIVTSGGKPAVLIGVLSDRLCTPIIVPDGVFTRPHSFPPVIGSI